MEMNRDLLAATGDGRFFANTTNQVFVLKSFSEDDLLNEFEDFEYTYRAAVLETLLSTPRELYSGPLVHVAIMPKFDLWENQHGNLPAFFMGTTDTRNCWADELTLTNSELVHRTGTHQQR